MIIVRSVRGQLGAIDSGPRAPPSGPLDCGWVLGMKSGHWTKRQCPSETSNPDWNDADSAFVVMADGMGGDLVLRAQIRNMKNLKNSMMKSEHELRHVTTTVRWKQAQGRRLDLVGCASRRHQGSNSFISQLLS